VNSTFEVSVTRENSCSNQVFFNNSILNFFWDFT
jgi:hypothetical protein